MAKRRNTPARPARPQSARYAPRYNGPRARAGLLATPTMDFGEIAHVEAIMAAEGVTLAPMSWQAQPLNTVMSSGTVTILPTAGLADIEKGRLAGVIVPGSDEADEDLEFGELINSAVVRQLPVMAFGGGVPQALMALGYRPPQDLPPGLLVHDGVRILDSADEVRDAVRVFHRAQAELGLS